MHKEINDLKEGYDVTNEFSASELKLSDIDIFNES